MTSQALYLDRQVVRGWDKNAQDAKVIFDPLRNQEIALIYTSCLLESSVLGHDYLTGRYRACHRIVVNITASHLTKCLIQLSPCTGHRRESDCRFQNSIMLISCP